MKKIILSLCILCTMFSASHAAVLTLNNNTPTPGQYTTFAAAQTAAGIGDTILVQGSPTSYGSITISKRLTLIGPGHKPNTVSGHGAVFSQLNISNNLTGVRIFGLNIIGSYWLGSNVDSVLLENIFGVSSAFGISENCNHIIVRGSVLSSINLSGSNADEIFIENNYITGSLGSWDGTGNKIVSNNIFAGSGGSNLISSGIRNTIFRNNIFYGTTANADTQTDCFYANNLSFGHTSNNTLPPTGQAGANNLVNVNPQFVNVQLPTASPSFSYTRNYRVQSGSPAKGAGIGGTDIGLYEPDFEFSMTGEPRRPQALSIIPTPVTVPVGGTTNVDFTIRKSTSNAQ
jgi:hypothetical protein